MGLKYGGKLVDDYSAMQGPCPEGFHIPTTQDWLNVRDYGKDLGLWTTTSSAANATSFRTYLKIPVAGFYSVDGSFSTTTGRYWSCQDTSTGQGWHRIYNNANFGMNYYAKAGGESIRPFKDTPAIPDNTWTTTFDGSSIATGAGVFYNATLGLISISSDGIKWVTVADKNLGATVVYNNGDTLSDSNCGGVFQWGNCYMFPRSSTISTSSTQIDATGYGPGNYYSSNTFITGSGSTFNWSSVNNRNLRGGTTGIQQKPAPIVKRYYGGKLVSNYSAMRGPCDEGFHVPLDTEWATINTIGQSLGAWTSTGGDNLGIYLKMPYSGFRTQSGAAVSYQGTLGRYHSSYCVSNSIYAKSLYFKSTEIDTNNTTYTKSAGYSLRPFKDEPVVPDNTWTNLYSGTGNAGIYHNSTLGLISLSSDGTTRTTIMDKNLGATAVWNNGDTLSEANCGKYYQWGNNYGFPRTGTISNTSSTQIDATGYGPGNYYSSDTFIKSSSGRDSSRNDNLRGGTTGVQQRPALIVKTYYGGKLVDDYSAIKGPCPDGFHIPTKNEINTMYSYMNTLGLTDTGLNFKEKLLLPNSARLKQETGTRENVNYSYLLTCNSAANGSASGIRIAQTSIYTGNNGTLSKSSGHSIRPFRDTPVTPDSSWTTIYDGSSVSTGAGVFHNSTLGLISLSGDGTNRLTIADKNLGATQVWNPGDTLTSDNAGKYYQRGNNYGFDMTGATTTSSTKVDASTYGPGNYYSSSTFITDDSSSIKAWDTTINTNLRGGTTGIQQKPAEIRSAY